VLLAIGFVFLPGTAVVGTDSQDQQVAVGAMQAGKLAAGHRKLVRDDLLRAGCATRPAVLPSDDLAPRDQRKRRRCGAGDRALKLPVEACGP
jgi:hypothetical protein